MRSLSVPREPGAGALPNVIVIGAAKCGTTSLHHYLDLHPQVSMAQEKELHFFSKEEVWDRGLDWYRAQFDGNASIRGEASVTYTAHPRVTGVPARMHAVVPDVRLVYIVRDPVERIIAAYLHRRSDGMEDRPLVQALLQLEGNDLVERSRYHYQLTRYLEVFPQSSIRVVCLEDLQTRPADVMGDLYTFLGLPPFESERFREILNPTVIKRRKGRLARALGRVGRSAPARVFTPETRRRLGAFLYRPITRRIERPTLDDDTRRRLVEFLAPDAEALRALTGQAYPMWCV